MGRRSRVEVIIDILSEATKEVNKTRMMYKCNLNYSCFSKYFNELLKKGLIAEVHSVHNGVKKYKTTEKGKELLEVLRKAKEFISI